MRRFSTKRRLTNAITISTACTTLFLWSRDWHALFAYLTAITATTLLVYGFDKLQSIRGGYRVPEVVLHRMTLCGGTLGAFLGQQLFRHKTYKRSFRIRFILIAVLQIVGIGLYVMYISGGISGTRGGVFAQKLQRWRDL